MLTEPCRATVVVIGAGQAGLSTAFHLQRRGYTSALTDQGGDRTFIVLDANVEPGGAWQHRWESLTMATVNGIFDLPGIPKPPIDPGTPSRDAVPRYFAAYEHDLGLPILRPVHVDRVTRADADPRGDLVVDTDNGVWFARAIINATGTWNNPLLPHYPGQESFLGRQLHTRDYRTLDEFAGQRVGVIGGGISAVQQLEEISRVATAFWFTRREPQFIEGEFEPETTGRAVIAEVTAAAEAGKQTGSIVGYTGLAWTPYAVAARDRGVLVRHPMFTAFTPHGVIAADGTHIALDAVLWATGFRPALTHLDPPGLRNDLGGIAVRGTRVAAEPRVHLVGFGPSQSTVGANRAGRAAVTEITRMLENSTPVLQGRR